MRLDDLVIPNGTQLSNAVKTSGIYDKFTVFGAAAYTGVIALEASADGANWVDTGLTVAASALLRVDSLQAEQLRLNSTLNEAAERTTPVHATGPRVS
ncbi:hypothetical protein LCGC14_0906740 [marine sediment metagenome]|uniref:Uncharacterized protein n=1 Tax=marine sediment metagenome TaxID=412755 RepID=A0A0F9NUW3_9ZZZZ